MNPGIRTFLVPIFCLLMTGLYLEAAEATPITAYGAPVASVGSVTPVAACGTSGVGSGCYNAGTNTINFFIPINESYGGVYGVDTSPGGFKVGTSYDVMNGPFDNSEILTMFIRYTPLAPMPLVSAVLDFTFLDLDLDGVNDPDGFFESVQFFDGAATALSPLLTMAPVSNPIYTISGDHSSQSIVFHNVLPFITGDPFYAELRFGSSMSESGKWKNTVESMKTKLVTATAVPVPSSLHLLALGFLLMIGFGAQSRVLRTR